MPLHKNINVKRPQKVSKWMPNKFSSPYSQAQGGRAAPAPRRYPGPVTRLETDLEIASGPQNHRTVEIKNPGKSGGGREWLGYKVPAPRTVGRGKTAVDQENPEKSSGNKGNSAEIQRKSAETDGNSCGQSGEPGENPKIPTVVKTPATIQETVRNTPNPLSPPVPSTVFDYTLIYGFSCGEQVEPVVHKILSMAGYHPEMYFVMDDVRRDRGQLAAVKIKFVPPFTAPCCHFLGQRIRYHPQLRKYYIGTVKKIKNYKKLTDKRRRRKVQKHVYAGGKR